MLNYQRVFPPNDSCALIAKHFCDHFCPQTTFRLALRLALRGNPAEAKICHLNLWVLDVAKCLEKKLYNDTLHTQETQTNQSINS